jgi:hypothetical protein
MRKATLPGMAGKPPADGAQPSGINGMIVTVAMKVATEPSGAQYAQLLVPEPSEDQCSEEPLRNSEEIGRALHAEDGVHPEDERTVGEEGNEALDFVVEPLLISEEEWVRRFQAQRLVSERV